MKYYWHLHHDILLESLTEPLKNRIAYIKEEKPKDEIKLRLKLLKPVKGKLPAEVIKAREGYNKAREGYNKAWEGYDKALNSPTMKKLHQKECGCAYDFKRETIFTKKNGLVK